MLEKDKLSTQRKIFQETGGGEIKSSMVSPYPPKWEPLLCIGWIKFARLCSDTHWRNSKTNFVFLIYCASALAMVTTHLTISYWCWALSRVIRVDLAIPSSFLFRTVNNIRESLAVAFSQVDCNPPQEKSTNLLINWIQNQSIN